MISLMIDGQHVEVAEGATILQAAQKIGINVPTLCYHPLLEPYAACRACMVEAVRNGKSELVTSCNTAVQEAMTVWTSSEPALATRKMNLELIMARAPAAEIVQQMAAEYGIKKTRFPIEHPEEKCILCGLCVRACESVVGVSAIGFANRGADRVVTTPFDKPSSTCIACGACAYFCPTAAITMEDIYRRKVLHQELYLGPTTAIRVPTRQPLPNVPAIDPNACIHFKTGGCQICEQVCEPGAINHKMQDEYEEIEVGTAVLSTGYQIFDCRKIPQYAYGRLPNVITSMEFEHLCHASGPTGGKLLLEDGSEPKSVGIVHCVGSRDKNFMPYCSRLCCMHAIKFAHLAKEKTDAEIYNFYIDIRAAGKGYEEFYDRVLEEGAHFIRGKVAEVTDCALAPEEENKLIIRVEDTLVGVVRRIPVDMVVLCPAMVPQPDAETMIKLFGLCASADAFFREQHPKLAPVSTDTDGIFIAGACQGPKDIPDSVVQGASAAGAVLSLGDEVAIEPIYATIDDQLCSGCKTCISVCPYDAIEYDAEKKISEIQQTLCKGCGSCVAACPSGASQQNCFTDEQLYAELEGALV
jgi:heterodisulfide reductase subunit A